MMARMSWPSETPTGGPACRIQMSPATGRPIANRQAVRSRNSSRADKRRPNTVPSPHKAAAPTANNAGTSWVTDTCKGSGKAIK